MEKKTHFSIWYIIGVVMVMLFVQALLSALLFRPNIEQVHYSEFMKKVQDGTIKSVEITDQNLVGIMKGTGENAKEKIYTTIRVPDDTLIPTLKAHNIDFYGKAQNPWLRNLLSWILPIAIFFFIWRWLFGRMGNTLSKGISSFGKNQAKVYTGSKADVTFDDVAGVEEAKEELKEIVEYLRNPGKYDKMGARLPKGVLLVGAPGTGKTLLAKAVAGEAGVKFFSLSGSDFVEMFVGVGASRVRDLFKQAQQQAPCIIFIDELDAVGKARGITPYSNDEREQTLNQLLSEMDGFNTAKGIVILAATNRPEILDPALLRPGRFDRQILVDKPDMSGRYEILKAHTRWVDLADDVALHRIAAETPGFVGADLANIVNEALLLAARKGKERVHMEEFDEAIERVVAGLKKKNRLMNPEEKRRVAYHEVGHAVIGSLLTDEPVHKISIIPRGIAALGYTIQLPTEERYLITKSELLGKIAVLLGGRASEDIFFDDISTGARNDLEKATEIARRMVVEYGMSDKVGLTTLEKPQQVFLGIEQQFNIEKRYSPVTAELIDEEVRDILTDNYRKVKKLITEHRDTIERIAQQLLQSEVMDEKTFTRLLKIEEQPLLK
ncbi:MAG: cell division protein FtsH [Spirochaetes bacterium DG_61]|nr:MAG: cell division protein FtsH [Spirochaetes bacterium DG_61]